MGLTFFRILAMAYRVSKGRFETLVTEALAELPEPFASFLEEVPVEIRQQPSAEQLRAARVQPGHTLLGLYQGRPRTARSVEDSGRMPDCITIFQGPIENACDNEDELIDQVRTTVLHEVGHHFGMGEADLEQLGFG